MILSLLALLWVLSSIEPITITPLAPNLPFYSALQHPYFYHPSLFISQYYYNPPLFSLLYPSSIPPFYYSIPPLLSLRLYPITPYYPSIYNLFPFIQPYSILSSIFLSLFIRLFTILYLLPVISPFLIPSSFVSNPLFQAFPVYPT
jgi:hypothetical protein